MRPCVLVFAGLDPSGGAGISADIEAIGAQGAHALPVVSALTVQDQNRVYAVRPVESALIAQQVQALLALPIRAVKIGIPGSAENARTIARCIGHLRERAPMLPVVFDPVLVSGQGDALAHGDAHEALAALLPCASVLVPNLPEAQLTGVNAAPHVLLTGGHGGGDTVINRWYHDGAEQSSWSWPRLAGQFHGSGCTLAAGIAAQLALGAPISLALDRAQQYTHSALERAYAIGRGQLIPQRHIKEPQ